MNDIRINKKTIKTSIINLSLLKFNFSFCSKILLKYNKQKDLGTSLINQASLIFLLNNENDHNELLDSIQKILDVLKKKDDKNESTEEHSSSYTINNRQNILPKEESTVNEFDKHRVFNKNMSFYSNSNQKNFNRTIRTLVLGISNLLKKDEKIYPHLIDENIIVEKNQEKNKGQETLYKQKLNKIISNKEKSKDSSLTLSDELPKDGNKKVEQIQKDNEYNDEIAISKLSETKKIKSFTSELKRINKKIIESQIKKIKIDKIGFDIVNKSTKFNKSIYNKVNKTIYSVINSDQRVKYFSKASKNIVLFNKKFKNHNVIKDLQSIISNYKENKNIISKLNVKIKKHKVSNDYDNQLLYKKISKIKDIIKYDKIKKIDNIQQIYNKKSNTNNIKYYREEFFNQKNREIFKLKKLNKIISQQDITKSISLINNLSKKYIINDENNKTIFHKNKFVSLDNSYFYDIYSHFIKNIKNKSTTKRYNDSILKYDNFSSNIKRNKLFESISNIYNIESIEKSNLNKMKLNFKKSKYHKILIGENEYVQSSNFKHVNNTKEKKFFRNIVHKNEVDINNVIDKCISNRLNKSYKQKFENTTTHYNERVMQMIDNNKKNNSSIEKTISKKEIQEMIDKSIPSISINRISELVSERLKRMSSLGNYKSTF